VPFYTWRSKYGGLEISSQFFDRAQAVKGGRKNWDEEMN
jgi:hypothetical protein